MRYMKLAAFVFMAVVSTAAMTQAQQMHAMKESSHSMHSMMSNKGKTMTFEGQVVGLNCYLSNGAHGTSAKACQTACVKNGDPVGILTKSGHVYLATVGRARPANSLLLPYMEKEVKVTGVVYGKNGMWLVNVAKVEPVKGKWKKK